MPVKKSSARKTTKRVIKKSTAKSKAKKNKSAFSSMTYKNADKFCSKSGRELKVKKTSKAGRNLRRCR